MANSNIPYQDPSTIDRRLDSESLDVSGTTVERERIQVSGSTATAIASVLAAAPGSAEFGLVTRNIPSGTQPISGTVTATATDLDIRDLTSTFDNLLAYQGGAWTATVSATNLDIRDMSSTLDNFLAYQGGTWNIGALSSITGTVHIDDNSSTLTVDAVNLDIRDLTSASDSVAAVQSGNWNVSTVQTVTAVTSITNAVTVTATNLDVRDFTSTADQVLAFEGGTWTVQPGNTQNTTPWLVKEVRSTTPTLTQINATTSSQSFIAANTNRLGAIIFNDSPNSVWLGFGGATVTGSSFTYTIMANGTWELPFNYTGLISGRWVAGQGTGQVKITELT